MAYHPDGLQEEIVYAVDINHKKDHHLNATELHKFSKPSLLILDAQQARAPVLPKGGLSSAVISAVVRTLRSGGNVLLPVDTAGRCLELLLTLEKKWVEKKYPYPVALLNHVSSCTVDFASRLMEWMSAEISRQFDNVRANPFDFKCIEAYQDLKEVQNLKGPKVRTH